MLANGYVLLDNSSLIDYQKIVDYLNEEWKIVTQDVKSTENALVFMVEGSMCSIGLIPSPIPNGEAIQQAKGNYYCPDAVDIASNHQAHLIVTVANQDKDVELESMKLYSKIIDSCLIQESATGVYTSGTVFSAAFYHKACQQYLSADDIPIMLWVFIAMAHTEHGNQLFTIGMEQFGKKEMEILNSKVDMKTLHQSLMAMCSHIITSGLVLQDGETIGFSASQKWKITLSESVYARSQHSLKIDIV